MNQQQSNHFGNSSHNQQTSVTNIHHSTTSSSSKPNHTRYQQLLSIIDEMGKDIRTTYLSNKNSTERLKRGIASARILIKDCQLNAKEIQNNCFLRLFVTFDYLYTFFFFI